MNFCYKCYHNLLTKGFHTMHCLTCFEFLIIFSVKLKIFIDRPLTHIIEYFSAEKLQILSDKGDITQACQKGLK